MTKIIHVLVIYFFKKNSLKFTYILTAAHKSETLLAVSSFSIAQPGTVLPPCANCADFADITRKH